MSFEDRFGGVGRLFGKAALDRLRQAHISVVGLGGVGSWAVEGLARSGVGQLTLVDLDDVCITNVNRQLPAIEGELGRPKALVLKERIQAINPEAQVTAIVDFFTVANAESILDRRCDALIDAIDHLSPKAQLIADCVRRDIACVTVGAAGGKRDGTAVRCAELADSTSDDLLRLVRKKLRRDHGFTPGEHGKFGVRCVYSPEHPVYPWSNGTCAAKPEPGGQTRLDCATGFGTAVFVTAAFGLAAAGEAVRLIVEREGIPPKDG